MQEISRLVVTFLVNSIWQIVLIAIIASGCAWIAKRVSAAYQHYVWVGALVLSIAVPVFGLARACVSPASQGPVLIASAAHVDYSAPLSSGHVGGGPTARNLTDSISPVWFDILKPQEHRIPFRSGFAVVIAACYLAFLLYRLIRFWVAWKNVKEIGGSSASITLSPLVASAAERCRAAFDLSSIPILCSPTIHAPATLGVRRPLILLPNAFSEMSDSATLTSVIGHEMAHIKRRDFALNLIYELLYLPISFHPAAALMKRHIARTRELACDELVLERLLGAPEYARALVTAADMCAGTRRRSYALGVFDTDNLEERIMKLTATRVRPHARAAKLVLFAASVILVFTAAVSSAYRFSPRQPEPLQEQSFKMHKLAVWIGYPDASSPLLEHGGGGMTLIPRWRLRPGAQPADRGVTGLDINIREQGDSIELAIAAVYSDITEQEWWKNKKEEPVGSYSLAGGEEVEVSELARLGFAPLRVKALGDGPVKLRIGEDFHVNNHVSKLKITGVEKTLDAYYLTVDNQYSATIYRWYISFDSGGAESGSSAALPPGITSRAIQLETGNVKNSTITIRAVELADGPIDGDPEIAFQFLAQREGERLQAPRALALIDEVLAKPNSEMRQALEPLESKLWALPEPATEAAGSALKARFSNLPSAQVSGISFFLKQGIYDARNRALFALSDFKEYEEPFSNCKTDECFQGFIRDFLERLRAEYLERISTLHSLKDVVTSE